MIRYYSNITIISFFMVESPNNYENLSNQTESNKNSEFLESINNDIKSIPQELQELSIKQIEKYKNSPQSSNDEYDLLDSIDALKSIESIKESNDWYQEFIDLLNNSENLDWLYQILKFDIDNVNDYIKDNWFPINQETLDAFNKNFWLNIQSRLDYSKNIMEKEIEREEIETEREETETEREKEKINILNSIKNQLIKHEEEFIDINDEEWNNFIDLLNNIENTESQKKLEALLSNQENLNNILSILQEIDRKEGIDSYSPESSYSKFTSKLIELNPGFEAKIKSFEEKENYNNFLGITDSTTARIYAWLWTENPDVEWNIFKNWDVSIDISKRPPQRILWDENFSLELDLPIWDFYPDILEHERSNQLIKPQLNSINVLLQNRDYIDDMLESNLNINQIKTNLKNTLNIEISFINTKEDLSEDNLIRLKNELENKLNQSNQELKQALRKKINEYRRNLEQKDRLTRETYKFLKSIGFDKIPQSITNNVIQQLNSNSGLRSSLGMTSEIDLSNGNLWFDSDFDENNITSQEKADFSKVFNIMLSWNEEWPINTDAILNDRWTPISDYTVFENFLETNKLRDTWFASKIMIDNIRSNNNQNK